MGDGGQLSRWADRSTARGFDGRYSSDSVSFWVSRLAEFGRLRAGDRVLDVGCGTGGFAGGIARLTGTTVLACDLSVRFVRYAAGADPSVGWLVADAQRLPITARSVDCVIMSLLLHRLPDPARAISEAHRVLRPAGSLVIKTIAPADAAGSLPYRLFPTMATAQLTRMPEVLTIASWITTAGFTDVSVERVARSHPIDADRLAATVTAEIPTRYPSLSPAELRHGLRRLHEESKDHPERRAESRTTTLLRGAKDRGP